MNDLNSCSFIGRLGDNPETSQVGDTTLTKFSIAVGRSWTDKQGVKVEKPEWVNIVTWGKLADICGEYLTKGKQIHIEGRMETDTYEKDGITKYATKVVANTMQMLGSKGDSQQSEPSQVAGVDDCPF